MNIIASNGINMCLIVVFIQNVFVNHLTKKFNQSELLFGITREISQCRAPEAQIYHLITILHVKV